MAPETWKPVVGYGTRYGVSSEGRVHSHRHGIMKLTPDSSGRPTVELHDGGRTTRKRFLVSGLVAAAFLGGRPPGMEVCHDDGDDTNNRLGNLRYDTPKGNQADKRRHGTHVEGSAVSWSILTEADVPIIRARIKAGDQKKRIASDYGVHPGTISSLAQGKSWKHVA